MGIMRMGYAHVRVTDMTEAKNHYAGTMGLYEVRNDGDKVYYKGWDEWDHHSVVLEEGGVGVVKFGWKAQHSSDLDDIEARAKKFGVTVERMSKGENPEIGDGVRFTTPSDHVFPPGVLNVLNGHGAPAGSSLTGDERVDRVTFTGSSTTGKHVMASAVTHLAPVSLELGGKGANIVFEDADLDNAVHWAVEAIFRNSGQICLAGSRLFVQKSIADEFMKRFVAAAEALSIGDPFDPSTKFSSLASRRHFEKVVSYVQQAQDLGGTIHTGGLPDDDRWLVRPTIISGLALDSAPYCEEIFGPVCVVNTFETEAEAVHLANDTRYGLNAMLFTENLSQAHRVSSNLRAGTVWVNCFFIRDLRTPFGGVGDSGVGREGGDFSREFFTEPKAVVMQIDRAVPGA